jgi:hypothetical protein
VPEAAADATAFAQLHAAQNEEFTRRERRYLEKISALTAERDTLLHNRDGWIDADTQLERIKTLHATVLAGVADFRESAVQVMNDQQKDLARAFRVRLDEVQGDLRATFAASEGGESATENVFARQRVLTKELDASHKLIEMLEASSKQLSAEKEDLVAQLDEKASDRTFLIDQLKAVRKDNEKLRLKIASNGEDLKEHRMGKTQALGGGSSGGHTSGGHRTPSSSSSRRAKKGGLGVGREVPVPDEPGAAQKPERWANNYGKELSAQAESDHLVLEAKLKETIERQQALIEIERRTSRDLQRRLQKDARERTELELFLRECVKDVLARVVAEQTKAALPRGAHAAGAVKARSASLPELPPIALTGLEKEARRKVMEELLSKERVLRLLFERTFPASEMPSTMLYNSVAERRHASHRETGRKEQRAVRAFTRRASG